MEMTEKNARLGEILQEMKKVLVAFSGGVDSAFLLRRAQQELGSDNVLAVVVASELFRDEEFDCAIALAEKLGIPVKKTAIKELENEAIVANTPESWYHSKKMLYSQLNETAMEHGYPFVLDGMIMDDKLDFRPGLRARTEAGVRSVLQEAALYKKEIRELSKGLDLQVWNKPVSCSLASRIPYGIRLDQQKIDQVNKAEKFIASLGFDMVRVRHHGDIARIEVSSEQAANLIAHAEKIDTALKDLGFSYIAMDLRGYRTGSMNETLPEESLQSHIS